MPLEINEIGITMHVTDGPSGFTAGDRGGQDDVDQHTPDREALIQECVKRVLEVLRAEHER